MVRSTSESRAEHNKADGQTQSDVIDISDDAQGSIGQ